MGVAYVVLPEEGAQAGLARALGLLQGRPVGEEVAEHQGVLVLEPIEHLGEVLLERVGDAVGQPAHVIDEHATLLDQPLQHTHRAALGVEPGQLLRMGDSAAPGRVARRWGRPWPRSRRRSPGTSPGWSG